MDNNKEPFKYYITKERLLEEEYEAVDTYPNTLLRLISYILIILGGAFCFYKLMYSDSDLIYDLLFIIGTIIGVYALFKLIFEKQILLAIFRNICCLLFDILLTIIFLPRLIIGKKQTSDTNSDESQ